MSFEGLVHLPDVAAGAWIGPRLAGRGGRVHCVVPDGYPAYARIFHPAEDEAGAPVTWAEVCRRTGRTPHALMQWQSIAGVMHHVTTEGRWPRRREVVHETSDWLGNEPVTGDMAPPTLSRVLDVLARFTPADVECIHAVWEGWGWLHHGAWGLLTVTSDHASAPEPPAPAGLPPAIVDGPKLLLPGRNYLLFRGPLRAALSVGHQVTAEWFAPQSPSLLWPPDRSWCLATEIDFDSTLVGGPAELVDALLQAPDLEVWQVEPTDDLTSAGDTING